MAKKATKGAVPYYRKSWSLADVRKFIDLNIKDGRKISHTASELAAKFKTTESSITYMRRRYNLALRRCRRQRPSTPARNTPSS